MTSKKSISTSVTHDFAQILRTAVLALIVSMGLPQFVLAQDAAAEDTVKVEAKAAGERAIEEVERWTFRLPKEPNRELKLNKTPILKWSNPAVGRVYGNVYVMTSDNRPFAIVGPYKWYAPYKGLDIECVSLASTGIEGVREGKKLWATDKPGIEWKAIPGSPAVGKSSLERQRQMKRFAEDFSAELIDKRVNDNGEEQQLRQLTQPVYRYESLPNQVLEGGIFAFVVATDPELFLLLEAQESDNAAVWRYGLARMNVDRLAVKYQQKQIWQADNLRDGANQGNLPYLSRNVAER